jgi:hypothetical protein
MFGLAGFHTVWICSGYSYKGSAEGEKAEIFLQQAFQREFAGGIPSRQVSGRKGSACAPVALIRETSGLAAPL